MQHDHHFCAVHVVARADCSTTVVTLKDAVIRCNLDVVRVPLSARVIDELRSITCADETEGTIDESSGLRTVNAGAGAGVAGKTAVAVSVAAYPAFGCCFLHVSVEPGAYGYIIETRDGRSRAEDAAVEFNDELHEFRAESRVATAEARLRSIKVTGSDEIFDSCFVPNATGDIGVGKNRSRLRENNCADRESRDRFLKFREIHWKEMGMENVQRGRLQEVKDCVVSQSRPRLSGGHLLKYKEDDTDTNESEPDS